MKKIILLLSVLICANVSAQITQVIPQTTLQGLKAATPSITATNYVLTKNSNWSGGVIGSSYGGAGAINGILKADGSGAVSAAVAGTDYLTPSTFTLATGNIFVGNGSNVATGVTPSLSASPGTFSLASTGILTMPNATTSLRGLLTSSDWNTFNNKQTALTFSSGVTNSSNTITVDPAQPTITTATALASVGTLTTGTWNATQIGTSYLPTNQTQLTTATNLTSVGTLTTGTWNGGLLTGTYGGTGVNNSTRTITIAGNLITTGAFNSTFAMGFTGTTTFPPQATTLVGKTGTAAQYQIPYYNDADQLTTNTSFKTDATGHLYVKGGQLFLNSQSTDYLFNSGGVHYLNSSTNFVIRIATAAQHTYGGGWQTITPTAQTSGVIADWALTGSASTNSTASTDRNTVLFDFATNTLQHATGTLAQNNDFLIKARTHRFVAASTLTDACTQYINGAPIAGTNATITRSWGLGVAGNVQFQNSLYVGGANVAPTAYIHLAAGSASGGSLKFTDGTLTTTPENGLMEKDASAFYLTPSGTNRYQIATVLTATATLDFGNTLSGAVTTLTMTCTGASTGDNCVIRPAVGVESADDNYDWYPWVSATNVVSVKFRNNNPIVAIDPASGVFKVIIIKN